jgi:hypothetical protein
LSHSIHQLFKEHSTMQRIAMTAFLLLALAIPAEASIIYSFVESGTTTIGATLTFNSPPAALDHAWSTSNASDIIEFRLLDPSLGPVGIYLPTISQGVVSSDGKSLDSGVITGFLAGGSSILVADIAGGPGSSLLIGDNSSARGDWVIRTAPSVPEPSSMALCGIAGLTGLVVARWRRCRG